MQPVANGFLRQDSSDISNAGPGRRSRRFLAMMSAMTFLCLSVVPAWGQMRALLPDVSEVPAGEAMPIDGVYTLAFNGAKFRIAAGRVVVVTPYTHLFVMSVTPGQVTTKDIVRAAPGVYAGYDLPALGPWRATLNADRTIEVHIQGKFGPFSSRLTPVEIDNPDWLEDEIAAMQGGTPQPAQFGVRARESQSPESIYPPGWDAR